jgi:hypothetical protein
VYTVVVSGDTCRANRCGIFDQPRRRHGLLTSAFRTRAIPPRYLDQGKFTRCVGTPRHGRSRSSGMKPGMSRGSSRRSHRRDRRRSVGSYRVSSPPRSGANVPAARYQHTCQDRCPPPRRRGPPPSAWAIASCALTRSSKVSSRA